MGCTHYDCLGAGQRVVQETFGGRSWRQHPELFRSMIETFRILRRVHELLLLLGEAGRLPLGPVQVRRRAELLQALQPPEGWSLRKLAAFERGSTCNDAKSFLVGLRGCVASPDRAASPRRSGRLAAPRR